MKRTGRLACAAGAAFCLLPSMAYADAGLPMLALAWPPMLWGLIPVILIEAAVFKDCGFAWSWSLKWNAIANAATTLIGIPLTWIVLVVLEMAVGYGASAAGLDGSGMPAWADKVLGVTLQAPWIAPFGQDDAWIVPTAFLILLVPFFLVSWRLEALIMRGKNDEMDDKAITRASLRANLVSYALLAMYPVFRFWL